MNQDEHGVGILFVWGLASDAAHAAAARAIEPAHLLVGLCTLGEWRPDDGAGLEPAVGDELAREAAGLRSRFLLAGVDPKALRRRIQPRPAHDPADDSTPEMLHRSSAARALFARADDLARAAGAARMDAQHLLRAVLEAPEPAWARAAAALGVDVLLAACFPPEDRAAEPQPDGVHVRIEVLEGTRTGRRLTFTERSRLIVGRAEDCHLVVADDTRISRHHCIVEINPPEVRLRDLGSRNGTYVNGERMAERRDSPDPDATRTLSPERDLHDGDVVSLGDHTRIAVHVVTPVPAAVTSPAPRTLVAAPPAPAGWPEPRPRTLVLRRCPVCDDELRPSDDELCVACRHDPERIMRLLADQVERGESRPGLFGGYTLLGRIGVGGMGTVYEARDEQSDERVALKVMVPHVPGLAKAEQVFLRESANSKLLRHRHIVRQREHGRWHGLFYIAMDFCEGGDLTGLLDRGHGRIAHGRAVRIAVQALEALEYAHGIEVPVRLPGDRIMVATGMVHRDISPGNLLFSQGVVKLADFGLSKAFETAGLSGITGEDTAAGKPRFMPRQQVVHFRRVRPAVDVWSVAACLYYMLTGSPPREFGSYTNDWMVVLETAPVPIRDRDAEVPAALAEVVGHALVDDPEIGFPTARELREALLATRSR